MSGAPLHVTNGDSVVHTLDARRAARPRPVLDRRAVRGPGARRPRRPPAWPGARGCGRGAGLGAGATRPRRPTRERDAALDARRRTSCCGSSTTCTTSCSSCRCSTAWPGRLARRAARGRDRRSRAGPRDLPRPGRAGARGARGPVARPPAASIPAQLALGQRAWAALAGRDPLGPGGARARRHPDAAAARRPRCERAAGGAAAAERRAGPQRAAAPARHRRRARARPWTPSSPTPSRRRRATPATRSSSRAWSGLAAGAAPLLAGPPDGQLVLTAGRRARPGRRGRRGAPARPRPLARRHAPRRSSTPGAGTPPPATSSRGRDGALSSAQWRSDGRS